MNKKQIEARSRFWRRAGRFYLMQVDSFDTQFVSLITQYIRCKALFEKYWNQL